MPKFRVSIVTSQIWEIEAETEDDAASFFPDGELLSDLNQSFRVEKIED